MWVWALCGWTPGARMHSEKVLCNAFTIIICSTSVLPAAYKKKNGGTSRGGKCSTIVSSNVNVMDFLPARRCSILIDVLLLYVCCARNSLSIHLGRARSPPNNHSAQQTFTAGLVPVKQCGWLSRPAAIFRHPLCPLIAFWAILYCCNFSQLGKQHHGMLRRFNIDID